MKHLIQKQELIIDIGPRTDAFRIQHAASQYARNTLLPALEKIFDELSGEDEVIHIDRLFIDLGWIGEAGLQATILDQSLYQFIKEELRRVILGERPDYPVRYSTSRENTLSQWWYYMEHGRLPWNGGQPGEQWYNKVLEMFSVDFSAITKLRKELQQKPFLRARISAQHNNGFLENLLTVMTSSRQQHLDMAVEEVCRVLHFVEQLSDRKLIGTKPADEPPPDRDLSQMILQWTTRLSDFLALPVAGRKEFIWNRMLLDAAARPAEWADRGGVAILLDWIWDSPALMQLLSAEFEGRSHPFISQFRSRYAATKERAERRGAPRSAGRHPLNAEEEDKQAKDQLPNARIPEANPDDQPPAAAAKEKSRLASNKELELAIIDACRILQFLAEKKEVLFTTADPAAGQQETSQANAALISLFTQWASRMADFLATPDHARKDIVRRWLREAAAARPAEWAREGAMTILLEKIWDDPVLMTIAAEALNLSTGKFAQLFKDRLTTLGKKDKTLESNTTGERPAFQKTVKETDLLFREEEVPEEGIYLQHAGVILLHPFLSTFFRRLKLWDGVGFADLYARQTAVYLLHYLATGEQQGPEYELVFPKMLCGYSLEMPLPGDIPLAEEALAEGIRLLENVLQSWEKLKNSSIDGLREGFLRRNGKLYTKNERLCLQVESGAIDVLLDSLPWNLSLVKLPWLKDILYVEWR
jgi:hypothetical protein